MRAENGRGAKASRWPVVALVWAVTVGLCILVYPVYSNWVAEYQAVEAVQTYLSGVSSLSPEQEQVEWDRARDYNARLTQVVAEDPFSSDLAGVDPFDEYFQVLDFDDMMGFIQIPAIDVDLPVYHGVSDTSLLRGVGHLMQTALPIGGAGAHCVLTGHTGLPSAKLFTDLDKLKTGDVFRLYVLSERLSYRIDSIEVVEPENVTSLAPIEGQDRVTLVTCTPYGINSHRLLVSGMRFDEPPAALPLAPKKEVPFKLVALPGAALLVMLAALVWGVGGGRSNKAVKKGRAETKRKAG